MQWFDLNGQSAVAAEQPRPHLRWALRDERGAPFAIEGVQPHAGAPCVHVLIEGAPGLLRLWTESGRLLTLYPPAAQARVAPRGERAVLLRPDAARRGRHLRVDVNLASGDELASWALPPDARLGPWSRRVSEGPDSWGYYALVAPRQVTLHRPGIATLVKKIKLFTPCQLLTTSGDDEHIALAEDTALWCYHRHHKGGALFEPGSDELGAATAITSCRDGSRIALARDAPTLSLRLFARGAPARVVPLDDPVTALAASPDDRWLALGHRSGRLSLRDALTGDLLTAFQAHAGPCVALAWEGDALWTGAPDGELARWSHPAASGRGLRS